MGTRKDWEEIEPLGGGGQSDVFLVRSLKRSMKRKLCLKTIRESLDGDKRADLANAVWEFARPDLPEELGALKVFKIPAEGASLDPPPGSEDYEKIERLKNEIAALSTGTSGLPKLLDSNVAERWIVTEYFPNRTLERNLGLYRGNARAAMRAFRSLVQTVAELHKRGYVHRDIKPANVFVRSKTELVLGDFGIVYVPDSVERVTLTGEKVGPRNYMPQWANLGSRQNDVQPCFDVYMLGKLLWSMVDGRPVLPREYHRSPHYDFDLSATFRNDPNMYLVNKVLDKCVVEYPQQCLVSAQDLLLVADEVLKIMEAGGQLLDEGIPRPCRVCGKGSYQRAADSRLLRFWIGGSDTQHMAVQTYMCDACHHVDFFGG